MFLKSAPTIWAGMKLKTRNFQSTRPKSYAPSSATPSIRWAALRTSATPLDVPFSKTSFKLPTKATSFNWPSDGT